MKQKKKFSFSARRKERDRYHGKRVPTYDWGDGENWYWMSPVPADFRKPYNRIKRARNKMALIKILAGQDDAPFQSEKRSIRWDYY